MYNLKNLSNLDRLGALKLELVGLALSNACKDENREKLIENLKLTSKLIIDTKLNEQNFDLETFKSVEQFVSSARKGR